MAGLSAYNQMKTGNNIQQHIHVQNKKWTPGKLLQKIANLGMRWESDVIKNSQAIGTIEAEVGGDGYMPSEFLYSLALSDIGHKKFIAYFDQTYEDQRKYLRKFAMNGEIEFMVETLADESIVYDDNNMFCRPFTTKLDTVLKEEYAKEIINYIEDSFIKIYNNFNFTKGHDAWSYFKQFLIDGIIAFEIVYNKEGNRIIGFKEIDGASIRPGVVKGKDGILHKGWVQYEDTHSMKREFMDEQIIYISYAKDNFSGRISYVERMVRSFNLLRVLENSRIIWNVMNSSFRLKMVVPIGTKSPQKAKAALAEMKSVFKEDIAIDFDSGELSYNGKPEMQLYKNYMYPSKNGEEIEIETLENNGPDMSDTETLGYFYNKLIKDSKVPNDRFSDGGLKSSGEWSMTGDGTSREEIRFSRFIKRLRSIFQEILLKPLMIQTYLKYPDLAGDNLFQGSVGITYNDDNLFEELKKQEVMSKRVDFVTEMLGVVVMKPDADGALEEVPYFSAKFLVEKYLKLDAMDISKNELYIAEQNKEVDEIIKRAQNNDDY